MHYARGWRDQLCSVGNGSNFTIEPFPELPKQLRLVNVFFPRKVILTSYVKMRKTLKNRILLLVFLQFG
jgi:hypothetical protein